MQTWQFSELHRDAKLREPTHEAFFDDSDVLTDVLSLIRESVQNSIDARVDPSAPVILRYGLSQFDPNSQVKSKYFAGLEEHLIAVRGADVVNHFGSVSRSLVVEDFNTHGLTGYTENKPPKPEDKVKSNFFYFVHAEGSTNKGEGKRGKWGIGKVVFPKVSLIKSFFIFSNRFSDNGISTVALGQSILKSHSIGEKNYQPDGWYANFHESKGYVELQDQDAESLKIDWGLKRNHEPGLSIVIPFVNERITADALVQSLLEQYFLAIINEDLVCVIEDEAGNETRLDSSTIQDHAAKINFADEKSKEHFLKLVALAVSAKAGNLKRFSATLDGINALSGELNVEKEDLEEIRTDFNNGESLVLEVPLLVPVPRSENQIQDKFFVLFRKNQGSTSQVTYSREGILVPGRRSKNTKNAICLVLVEPGPIADLLGLSEGPAHENWAPDADKFRSTYGSNVKAAQVISYVRQQPVNFVNSLLAASETLDSSLLSRYFSIPSSSNLGEKSETSGHSLDHQSTQDQVRITSTETGFKVADAGNLLPAKSQIAVSVAYGVTKGNPFSKWSPNDFLLEGLDMSSRNVSIVSVAGNKAIFEIDSSEFEVGFSGFDQLRNIEIDIQTPIIGKKVGNA